MNDLKRYRHSLRRNQLAPSAKHFVVECHYRTWKALTFYEATLLRQKIFYFAEWHGSKSSPARRPFCSNRDGLGSRKKSRSISRTIMTQLSIDDLDISSQQLTHHIPMHVRQTKIAALKTVGQLGVVEAEQVQDRGVQVVDVDFVGGRVEAELVGLAERGAGLHAAAGQPQ